MKNRIDAIMQDVATSRWVLQWLYPLPVISSTCYYVELPIYNAAVVARVIVSCLQEY